MKYHKIEKGVYTIEKIVAVLEKDGVDARPVDDDVLLDFSYSRDTAKHPQTLIVGGELKIVPDSTTEMQHKSIIDKISWRVLGIRTDPVWLQRAQLNPEWNGNNIAYSVTVESNTEPVHQEVIQIPGVLPVIAFI